MKKAMRRSVILLSFVLLLVASSFSVHVVCESTNCTGPCTCVGDEWGHGPMPCWFWCVQGEDYSQCVPWVPDGCFSRAQ